jgi:hypothetical protein
VYLLRGSKKEGLMSEGQVNPLIEKLDRKMRRWRSLAIIAATLLVLLLALGFWSNLRYQVAVAREQQAVARARAEAAEREALHSRQLQERREQAKERPMK